MAITVLSEFEFTKDTITSNLLSPFMRPVLYFKVSGAGGVSDPTAEIEFDGTAEDVTIEAVFLETISTEHYFYADISDVMKYILMSFDGGDYPDDLEFINGDLIQMFDEYFRSLDIDIWFERGTGDEQMDDVTGVWLYLADQIPIDSGFNLWKIMAMQHLSPMKWIKDTYNAFFMWLQTGGAAIMNTKQLITSFINHTFDTFTASGTTITSAITDGSDYAYCASSQFAIKDGDSVVVLVEITSISGAYPKVALLSASGGSWKSNQIQTDAGPLLCFLTATEDVPDTYVAFESGLAAAEWTSNTVLVYRAMYSTLAADGYYQVKFAKDTDILNAGPNTIEIRNTGGTVTLAIDYDPECFHIPVCWQHPLLGYVSFPFNGNKITNISASKIAERERFMTSMKSVNSLKQVTGYDESRRVTLTTKADIQYWPLLETIYSSRHVYLFIGESEEDDTTLSWIECEVAGGTSIRSDRVRGVFTIDLILPENFNVKF